MAPTSRSRLQALLKNVGNGTIPHVSGLRLDDEDITLVFTHERLQPRNIVNIRITCLGGSYVAYTDADVPASFASQLEETAAKSDGMGHIEMLRDLAERLSFSLDPRSAVVIYDSDDDLPQDGDGDGDISSSDSDEEHSFNCGDEEVDAFGLVASGAPPGQQLRFPPQVLENIRRDLHRVRQAGFKPGIVTHPGSGSSTFIISASARVDKLCLSSQSREAWNLEPSEFIVLLIRYKYNCIDYRNLDQILESPSQASGIDFVLRGCAKYKPTPRQAQAAFAHKEDPAKVPTTNPGKSREQKLKTLVVDSSIDDLLDREFVPLLRMHRSVGGSWEHNHAVILRMQNNVAMGKSPQYGLDATKASASDAQHEKNLPTFVARDHLFDKCESHSFPLVAAQFAFRYFINCTKYCLICHELQPGNHGLVKPYVCANPLCLYKYMRLGFGPSIEHEIIAQPYVVDLLISFCWAALSAGSGDRIKELPLGLGLQVPSMTTVKRSQKPESPPSGNMGSFYFLDPIKATLSWRLNTLTLSSPTNRRHFYKGQCITVATYEYDAIFKSDTVILHQARVAGQLGDSATFQLAIMSRVLEPDYTLLYESEAASIGRPDQDAWVALHNQDLDDVPECDRVRMLRLLMVNIPTVEDMRNHLLSNAGARLHGWPKMTPATLSLLRWIVASNRSWIVQLDDAPWEDERRRSSFAGSFSRESKKLSGVSGWLQFRFAQGSPERDALFRAACEYVQKPARTLLAWHGSPLPNWHSIIRTGLNFDDRLHGRAYGDGVYLSQQFDYSVTYSTQHINHVGPGIVPWPRSALQVSSAISLVEVVNAPEQFFRATPHYVVQQTEWIQCRYLLVAPRIAMKRDTTAVPQPALYNQDHHYKVLGPRNEEMRVPREAIPTATPQGQTGPFSSSQSLLAARGHQPDSGNEDEDEKDKEFLRLRQKPHPVEKPVEDLTDFRPGTLDFSTLPQLGVPAYSTSIASRALGVEMKKLRHVQEKTPAHELGWYIDFNRVDNMYQWIVELHSFDKGLPLAQDMKLAKMTSIVLEMRFGGDFPLSPPFVRVVRPRFLPFLNGGGGHVTAGGAMCMELLTSNGWSPANSLESVIVQVRAAMCSEEPRPARLMPMQGPIPTNQYGASEAFSAFRRAATTHGWQVPASMFQIQGAS